jgi:hypothetical protein
MLADSQSAGIYWTELSGVCDETNHETAYIQPTAPQTMIQPPSSFAFDNEAPSPPEASTVLLPEGESPPIRKRKAMAPRGQRKTARLSGGFIPVKLEPPAASGVEVVTDVSPMATQDSGQLGLDAAADAGESASQVKLDGRGKHWKDKFAQGLGPKPSLATANWADDRKQAEAAFVRDFKLQLPWSKPGARKMGNTSKVIYLMLMTHSLRGDVVLETTDAAARF